MSQINAYQVLSFNAGNLAKALSNKYLLKSEVPVVKRKHFRYLLNYLGPEGLVASTIVVEDPYVSKSYLNDYASYYSLCFESFPRQTKRIHFFQSKFDKKTFNAAILNPEGTASKKIFNEANYLGHVVAKPLPDSIIGPTLLRTFQGDSNRTYSTKKYHVNLFGKKLSYYSLVFQEQDTVVSACATMAIWMAFHKAAKLFQTLAPGPNEITSSAGNLFLTTGRSFPNHGLDYHQIGNALKSVGLVSELRNTKPPFSDMFNLKAFIYAYNKIGAPVLLGIKLTPGRHLVAVSGFHIDMNETFLPDSSIGLRAYKMDKIYVHDDQIGPFARTRIVPLNDDGSEYQLETPLPPLAPDGNEDNITSEVVSAHALVHPKIRIQYEEVFTLVNKLNLILGLSFDDTEDPLEWDIYLDFSNNYKEDLRNSTMVRAVKKKPLFSSYPKHLWVARLRLGDTIIMDLLYDSTAIARSFYCCGINFHHEEYIALFKALLGLPVYCDALTRVGGNKIVNYFKSELALYSDF